jgi:hypothetical protein
LGFWRSSDKNCTLKRWKSVKMVKGIPEDPHFVALGGFGDCQLRTPLKNWGKLSKSWKASLRIVTEFSVGPWGSSDENCTHRCWKSVKIVKRILQDPHWLEHGGLGDHQIRTALKKGENVSKWWKWFLRILSLLDLGVLEIVSWKLLCSCEDSCESSQGWLWGSWGSSVKSSTQN